MSLIDTLDKEIKETREEDVSAKLDLWISRCRKEGVSIHALEKLLYLHYHAAADLPRRSLSRFVSNTAGISQEKNSADIDKNGSAPILPPKKPGLINKILEKIGLSK